MTVSPETFSASAVSSTERPPKNRISTTCALRASNAASAVSASSSATRSRDGSGETTSASSRDTFCAPPPRSWYAFARAKSTRIRRINRDDIAKKCAPSCQFTCLMSTSRAKPPLPSAVACHGRPPHQRLPARTKAEEERTVVGAAAGVLRVIRGRESRHIGDVLAQRQLPVLVEIGERHVGVVLRDELRRRGREVREIVRRPPVGEP